MITHRLTVEAFRFITIGDDGKQFAIVKYQEFDLVATVGHILKENEIKDQPSWKTLDGDNVSQIDSETYRIDSTQIILKKDSRK